MSITCGIVGLPNVGKSTLFNALTSSMKAQAANYPFCTIEPNSALVEVPDPRLINLAKLGGSEKIIATQIEFVDIAGLVRGASKGEGLGNQFLSHIREVNAIIHVLRCFEDEDITHVDGSVNPLRDFATINLELVIADFQSLEKRLPNLEKKARASDKQAIVQINLIKKLLPLLEEGHNATSLVLSDEQEIIELRNMQLLTTKPFMVVCNVKEGDALEGNKYTREVRDHFEKMGVPVVIISAQIEQEIAQLETKEEKLEFLASIGLEQTGLDQIIFSSYSLLNLITFFTVGPKEARAWTVKRGAKAPNAAGVIHTDFEKGFIRAETISYDDYLKYEGEVAAKESGRLRLEGKEYIVQDGDVFHFRFNT